MSSRRLREIPPHNCLTRWPTEVTNHADEQPCKVRKTTKHEQEKDVTLVSVDGMRTLQQLLGDEKKSRAPISTKNTNTTETTTKDGTTTIEAENHELTKLLASLW